MIRNNKFRRSTDTVGNISGYGWGAILMVLGLAVFVFGAAAA